MATGQTTDYEGGWVVGALHRDATCDRFFHLGKGMVFTTPIL
jgi:hypothetical protein